MNEHRVTNSPLICDFVKLILIQLELWYIVTIINLRFFVLYYFLNLQKKISAQKFNLTGTMGK